MKKRVRKGEKIALCRMCKGVGRLPYGSVCPQCQGSGRVIVSAVIDVDIRPWVEGD